MNIMLSCELISQKISLKSICKVVEYPGDTWTQMNIAHCITSFV